MPKPKTSESDILVDEISELCARTRVPGVSIAVVRDGRLACTTAVGVLHRDSAEPVRAETVFQAASLTKPVFAAAVIRLVELDVLGLDTPLSDCLPYQYVADDALLHLVTARHVLSHTTGWPNWRPTGQLLRRESPPGASFRYSGEGYVYLQHVVEHLTGEPLDALVRAHVLMPLGMTDSSFEWRPPEDRSTAAGHGRDGDPISRYIGEWPNAASSLHTTPSDYARFMAAVMNPDRAPWSIGPASLTEMLHPQVTVGERVSWGLGWGLEIGSRGHAFWHWGDNPGYKSFAIALREAGKAVVVMTNGDAGQAVCEHVIDRLLGGDHPALAWLARSR